jgi:hypothetical protein
VAWGVRVEILYWRQSNAVRWIHGGRHGDNWSEWRCRVMRCRGHGLSEVKRGRGVCCNGQGKRDRVGS